MVVSGENSQYLSCMGRGLRRVSYVVEEFGTVYWDIGNRDTIRLVFSRVGVEEHVQRQRLLQEGGWLGGY